MKEALWMLVGALVAGGAAFILLSFQRRFEAARTKRLAEDAEQRHEDRIAAALDQLKTSFAALSRDALSANTDDFLKLAETKLDKQTAQANQTLDTKKKLIDVRLDELNRKLSTLNDLIHKVERERAEAHGSLTGQIERVTQTTARLQDTTAQLREALANPKRRGQWGERMAEDVLRLAGLVERVNYVKQKKLSGGTIPDFTFLLPDNRCVHMDVKFPLTNYLKMIDATEEASISDYAAKFRTDVRSLIREVTTRGYIDPAAGTLDCVLVFIPMEQPYAFMHENDPALLDDALGRKVVLCSPLTLYAILAVLRQSVDSFRLRQASDRILTLLAEFGKQWTKYVEEMARMGKRLDDTMSTYQELVGVRTRQLDRQLDKIDDLRQVRDAELPPDEARDAPFPSSVAVRNDLDRSV